MNAKPDKWEVQARDLDKRLAAIKALVDKQAEDDNLWFIAEQCTDLYLQAALRKLHAVIEASGPLPAAPEAHAGKPKGESK